MRKKVYYGRDMPESVVAVVYALCGDYERRRKILRGRPRDGTRAVCERINRVIDEALETVEPAMRRELLEDMARGRGYSRSPLCCMISKNAYYDRRRAVVRAIAEGLGIF